jgi:hypothetical protein
LSVFQAFFVRRFIAESAHSLLELPRVRGTHPACTDPRLAAECDRLAMQVCDHEFADSQAPSFVRLRKKGSRSYASFTMRPESATV